MGALVINSAGLILDILGAILIFVFSIPSKIDRDGHNYLILESEDGKEKKVVINMQDYSERWTLLMIVLVPVFVGIFIISFPALVIGMTIAGLVHYVWRKVAALSKRVVKKKNARTRK